MSHPRPPSGTPPPVVAEVGSERLDLVAFAGAICDRYHAHYADEIERYGEGGRDWCRHDNQCWRVGLGPRVGRGGRATRR